MKKYTLIIAFFFAANSCFAQWQQEISVDSILIMARTENPFFVISKIYNRPFDEKEVYYNETLKSFLLKVFDQEEIVNKKLRVQKDDFEKMSNDYIDHSIRVECNSMKINADSIIKNKRIRAEFWDTIVSERMQKYRKEYESKKLYPEGTMAFFERVPYLEAYLLIKQYWLETNNKQILETLIKMNDPDAIIVYNKSIKEALEIGKNSIYSELIGMPRFLGSVETQYSVNKQIELLSYDYKFQKWSEGPPNIFNCEVLKELLNRIEHTFKGETFPWQKEKSCEKQLENYLPGIKIAAERLSQFYKEQQEYWMVNMPFYKK